MLRLSLASDPVSVSHRGGGNYENKSYQSKKSIARGRLHLVKADNAILGTRDARQLVDIECTKASEELTTGY